MTPRCIIAAIPPLDELLAAAVPDDLAASVSFAPARRAEYLAWRAVVRRELGPVAIAYDAVGAPFLRGSAWHLSVAHTDGRVAVALSPERCAVDIERADRDLARVRARYLSAGEERLAAGDPLFPVAAWCAKECLYKLAGRRELELLGDLRLTAFDAAAGRIAGRILGGAEVALRIERRDDLVAVYRI